MTVEEDQATFPLGLQKFGKGGDTNRSQWGIYGRGMVSVMERMANGLLKEALNFAHTVFKGVFVDMDKTSPFRWIPHFKAMKHAD
ncbi:MAG: hypothetical protein NPIRA03_27130 [Nitrospirales bacterium]|nr:MAG: hypothetical protein NPIRA03_27130 [Nitrospirales bacterium]